MIHCRLNEEAHPSAAFSRSPAARLQPIKQDEWLCPAGRGGSWAPELGALLPNMKQDEGEALGATMSPRIRWMAGKDTCDRSDRQVVTGHGCPIPRGPPGPWLCGLACRVPPHWTASPSLSINPSPGWSLLASRPGSHWPLPARDLGCGGHCPALGSASHTWSCQGHPQCPHQG